MKSTDRDYVGLLSEDGFSGTGLKNGENHLKCWFKGSSGTEFYGTEYYTKEWTPSFEDDEGQSLRGWASTGTAQVIHLKNSHKRIPKVESCNW